MDASDSKSADTRELQFYGQFHDSESSKAFHGILNRAGVCVIDLKAFAKFLYQTDALQIIGI